MSNAKAWYKSKTIWFNLVSMALLGAEQNFALLESVMGDKVYGVSLFVIMIANISLRTITTSAVTK